jgi:hypothetical protein
VPLCPLAELVSAESHRFLIAGDRTGTCTGDYIPEWTPVIGPTFRSEPDRRIISGVKPNPAMTIRLCHECNQPIPVRKSLLVGTTTEVRSFDFDDRGHDALPIRPIERP